jgi:hypothetical protein
MTAPTINLTGFYGIPDPVWCVKCDSPDPGVIDHYSREWRGDNWFEGASWRIQVTQRVQHGPDGELIEGLAVIELIDVDGTYGSTRGLVRGLMLAQQLADEINAGRGRS